MKWEKNSGGPAGDECQNLVAFVPDIAPTLASAGGGVPGTTADTADGLVVFDPVQITSRENRSNPRPGDPCHTLTTDQPPVMAYDLRGRDGASGGSSRSYAAGPAFGVRRLTPIECERLQGMPDDYTRIRRNGKDAPRYRAIGNAMAVPVIRWILRRLTIVHYGLDPADDMEPCAFCAWPFDVGALGIYGCPNCEGEGL